MPTVGSELGHRPEAITWDLHPDVVGNNGVGIEIELEGLAGHVPTTPDGWRVIPDGSLRDGGVEFVFNGPAGGAELYNRMVRFGECIAGLSSTPSCSERTSVHVHIDVRHLEWTQVWNMAVLYTIVEPYLFTLCGEHREGNIYSLSYEKGQGQIRHLSHMRTLRGFLGTPSEMRPKYSAMNLSSLLDFGSLEFRGMEGTYDTSRIINWTNHLLSLYEYAKQYQGSVEDLPALMSRLQPRGFLHEIFGALTSEVIEEDVRERVYRGAWVAEDVLFGSRLDGIREELTESDGGYDLLEAFGVSQQEAIQTTTTRHGSVNFSQYQSVSSGRVQYTPAPVPRSTPPVQAPPLQPNQSHARVRLSAAAHNYVTTNHPRVEVRDSDRSLGYRQAVRVLQAAFGDSSDISISVHGIGRLGSIFDDRSNA